MSENYVYEVWDTSNDKVLLQTTDKEEAVLASEEHCRLGGHGACVEWEGDKSKLVGLW